MSGCYGDLLIKKECEGKFLLCGNSRKCVVGKVFTDKDRRSVDTIDEETNSTAPTLER